MPWHNRDPGPPGSLLPSPSIGEKTPSQATPRLMISFLRTGEKGWNAALIRCGGKKTAFVNMGELNSLRLTFFPQH